MYLIKLHFPPYLIWEYKFFWILNLKIRSVRLIFIQVYKRILSLTVIYEKGLCKMAYMCMYN